MSVCNPTWEAEAGKTSMNLELVWPTQQAPSQLALQSWTLSQHRKEKGKGKRKEEKIGWLFLKRRDVNCIPTFIEELEGISSLNARCTEEFRTQDCYFCGIICYSGEATEIAALSECFIVYNTFILRFIMLECQENSCSNFLCRFLQILGRVCSHLAVFGI